MPVRTAHARAEGADDRRRLSAQGTVAGGAPFVGLMEPDSYALARVLEQGQGVTERPEVMDQLIQPSKVHLLADVPEIATVRSVT